MEQLASGVRIDWDAGTVEAEGRCAADPRAPSAEVARIKAERIARERAREQMKKALVALPGARWPSRPVPAALDPILEGAETVATELGSNGSVSLRLRLKLSALPTPPLPPRQEGQKKGRSPKGGEAAKATQAARGDREP